MRPREFETPSSPAADVGFGLDTLARFFAHAQERTQEGLAFTGDGDQVDLPNLAASLVAPYQDEVIAIRTS